MAKGIRPHRRAGKLVWGILQPELCHLLEAVCSKQADKPTTRIQFKQTRACANSWDGTALGKHGYQKFSLIHRSQLRFVAYFVTPPSMQ